MMKDDLVSIIVPVYNVEAFLPRCLDSILAQEYEAVEILLVDDGSGDESGKICDAYAGKDSRFTVIHKSNGGLSDARNAGLGAAKGKYVSFVDSDDFIHPSFIGRLKEAMDRTGCRIARCDIREVEGSEEPFSLPEPEYHVCGPEEYLAKIDRTNGGFSVCNKLFSRALFEDILFPCGRLHEDVAVIYRLIDQAGSIVSVDQPLYYYYRNENSITKSRVKPARLDDLEFRMDLFEYCRKKNWKSAAYNAGEMILRRILDAQKISSQDIDDYPEYKRRLRHIKRRFAGTVLFRQEWSLRHKLAVLYRFYINHKHA